MLKKNIPSWFTNNNDNGRFSSVILDRSNDKKKLKKNYQQFHQHFWHAKIINETSPMIL